MGPTLERLARECHPALRRGAQPGWTQPMLATLTDERFSDPDWIFERKLDGVRCLAFRRRGRVSLMSRNRKALDNHYPELVEAISGQRTDPFIADGEIVAFDRGQTSFARLQGRMQLTDPDAARRTGIAVFLYLFDLLHVARFDVTGLQIVRGGVVVGRALLGALAPPKKLTVTKIRRRTSLQVRVKGVTRGKLKFKIVAKKLNGRTRVKATIRQSKRR